MAQAIQHQLQLQTKPTDEGDHTLYRATCRCGWGAVAWYSVDDFVFRSYARHATERANQLEAELLRLSDQT